ncbi:MAG: hypothetical protein EOP56_14805 [Sphingobacteriales bacterium]|nr:MAG: hypothetical protein EOP56_14805 [Sphingobacteriales bacterium]
MELEEMKNLWKKYDNVIAENRMLNEKLVKELLQNKSSNSLAKMKNAEYFGLIFCICLFCVFIAMSGRAWASVEMTISFFILIGALGASIYAGIYKLRLLNSIDFSHSLTDLTETMQRFKLFISKERIFGVAVLPFIVLPAYIFIDGYSIAQLMDRLPGLLLGCAAGIPVAFILYRSLYFDNIKQINQSLEDARTFRQDAI